MDDKPTVFVVDDDSAILASLGMLIKGIGLNVLTYTNCRDFLDEYDPDRHGCLILDIRMPDMDGLELLRILTENQYSLPVIIITGHGDIQMAVEAIKAGAVEFIEKPFRDQLLVETINKALKSDAERKNRRIKQAAFQDKLSLLTPREREVIGFLADCKNHKEIAAELGITTKTADFHSLNILAKLGMDSITQIVRSSIELKLP